MPYAAADAPPPTSCLKKRISFATPTNGGHEPTRRSSVDGRLSGMPGPLDGSPRWLDRADSPKWLPERLSALAVLGPRLTDDEVRL